MSIETTILLDFTARYVQNLEPAHILRTFSELQTPITHHLGCINYYSKKNTILGDFILYEGHVETYKNSYQSYFLQCVVLLMANSLAVG